MYDIVNGLNRGCFLLSFASESESTMVLHIVNIIANNEDYNGGLENQLIWSGYVTKKGKRMGLPTMRYFVLRGIELQLFKSHQNWENGEEPSQKFSLLGCDFSQKRSDGKEVKFRKRGSSDEDGFLTLRMLSQVERDDFLSICAQTLGEAIARNKNHLSLTPNGNSNTMTRGTSIMRMSMDESESESEGDKSDGMATTPRSKMEDEKDSQREANGGQQLSARSAVETTTPSSTNRALGNEMDSDSSNFVLLNDSGGGLGDVIERSQTLNRGMAGPSSFYESAHAAHLVSDQLVEKRSQRYNRHLEQLQHTPRMYGASHIKALNRLAKRRASDIDFIEETFKGDEVKLASQKDEHLQTCKLLDTLSKSIISGAFLNRTLFIHKAVWTQNKVMVSNYEQKLETFDAVAKGLNKAFDDIDLTWLQKDNFKNADSFLKKMKECHSTLLAASTELETYAQKSVIKSKQTGVGKLWNSLKDKSQSKVYDNSEYKELVRQICSHGSKIEMYYTYLSTSQHNHNLLIALEEVCKLMSVFSGVVLSDLKEFLKVYLRRGAKNLYE
ncbi:hypothetical protein RFI_09507 [Reticulomyxa filosa]|uniref:PH domain-containing protein n=1 Tax=Reticulomyxa filosa TaxID=46433 RepID=X6NNV3_RETFI|nr:hypothetical protein RFI_09507 [Reticulomyxa filosa]|eukprot:ETO27618.1 hypothetical protein RFI_09507 [Reticulomyxa filosa]